MEIPSGIRLKPLGRRGAIAVWLVDGAAIRRDLDPDFTNFGQHYRFPYIPELEFWLDREAVPNERRYFIEHLLVEWKLMKDGRSYFDACVQADSRERSERNKSDAKKCNAKSRRGVAVELAHKKILGRAGNLMIWLVDGRYVRTKHDIEFTEGGHGLVYRYIPKNEIWLDDDLMASERPYVLLHELYERALMKKGVNYLPAHSRALAMEWKARHGLTNMARWWKKMEVKMA